jgi:MFS family permease
VATSETIKTRTLRLSCFLGLQRNIVGVLFTVVLVGMAERMAERFLPIYMLALGGGALAIGLLQAMDNLLSALNSFPGGYLSDRVGTKKSLLIFNLVAIAGFVVVILIPNWQAVLAGAVLFISWSAISLPATVSPIYRVFAPGQTHHMHEQALFGQAHPHGARPFARRPFHQYLG